MVPQTIRTNIAALALFFFGGETALAASANLQVARTAIELTNGAKRPRAPVAGLPAGPVAEHYAEKWRSASADMRAELDVLAACDADRSTCSATARQFLAIVEAGREMQGRARLGIVNRAINLTIQARSDIAQHGAADVWSSPLATFRSRKGDCEDYAIAKFAALVLAGVPTQDLRLVIVRNLKADGAHAVLAAWFGDRWLVLDSRRFLLLEDRRILTEYRPLLAFTLEPAVRKKASGIRG